MLEHSDIADVAVIGIVSKEEATELPRLVPTSFSFRNTISLTASRSHRAYVVHANPASLKNDVDKIEFGKSVQEWIKTKVSRHKFLRGGKYSACLCQMIFRAGSLIVSVWR
jgi:4-coumarate--CoA ligase